MSESGDAIVITGDLALDLRANAHLFKHPMPKLDGRKRFRFTIDWYPDLSATTVGEPSREGVPPEQKARR